MPDFSVKPAVTTAFKSYKSEKTSQLKKAYSDFMGEITFIGEENVFDILSCTEELETSTEYGYSQQKGIGQKPVLVYNGEGLKQYSLPVKLHHSYCRPDFILEQLKMKGSEREPFSYFQGEKYIGEYVIEKITEKIVNAYQGVTLYAEIIVDILEFADLEDEEFEQQTKTNVEITSDVKSVSNDIPKTPVELVKDTGNDVFKKLTDDAVNQALRTAKSYLDGTIGEITNGSI